MPENVYHNASSQSTIDTGSNNQYYSTDQETNNQQTETDPNAESHYDYDAGVCTNDVVSDNGSSTEASFDPSNSSSSDDTGSDYTESDSDSEDEEKNYCDGNDGEDYSDDDSGNDTIDEEDDNKEESTPTQEDDNNDTSDNSEGDFIEKNKDLMQKVCDVLKFIYPDCDITPSEFFTGAQECINKYAGIGSGGQGEGDDNSNSKPLNDKDLENLVKGFCKIYNTKWEELNNIISNESQKFEPKPPIVLDGYTPIEKDDTDKQEEIRTKNLDDAVKEIREKTSGTTQNDSEIEKKRKRALAEYCTNNKDAVLSYIKYLLKQFYDQWLLPDGSGDRFPYVINIANNIDIGPRNNNYLADDIKDDEQQKIIKEIKKDNNNPKYGNYVFYEGKYQEYRYLKKSSEKEYNKAKAKDKGKYIIINNEDKIDYYLKSDGDSFILVGNKVLDLSENSNLIRYYFYRSNKEKIKKAVLTLDIFNEFKKIKDYKSKSLDNINKNELTKKAKIDPNDKETIIKYFVLKDKTKDDEGNYVIINDNLYENTDSKILWYNDSLQETYNLQYYSNGDITLGKASPIQMQTVAKLLFERFSKISTSDKKNLQDDLSDRNTYTFKNYLHDLGIGMDCSGYATRALAFVMEKLQIPICEQLKTIGPAYGRLRTNCYKLYNENYDTEIKGSKIIHTASINDTFSDLHSKIQVGDIEMKDKPGGKFHIRIIADVGVDDNKVSYYKDHQSTTADNRSGIKETTIVDAPSKKDTRKKYSDYKISEGIYYKFARPHVFNNEEKLKSYFKNMLIRFGSTPN